MLQDEMFVNLSLAFFIYFVKQKFAINSETSHLASM